ncbi:PIG-L family deacetylase [Streptomyces abikoensis]|uniref:PIG-L family deacetylase n=1 Tax=Streptomyces abikoensis TaxID=97398 RepID=UPI00368279A3
MRAFRRRTVLTGLLALAVAGCSTGTPHSSSTAQGDVAADRSNGAVTTLQIVAHPDDDLYFMNPDVNQSIGGQHRVVSVYFTSGEANGINKVPGSKDQPRKDFAGYAGARQQGLRQAYAFMATGNAHAEWKRGALELPGGLKAETDSLADNPAVTLVFLGVAQHTQDRPGQPDVRVSTLWSNPKAKSENRVATGSTVTEARSLTKAQVTDALTGVLDRFKPTLVRTMDLDPDMQVHDEANRLHHDQRGYSDHPDHTAVAQFTYAALQRYKGPGNGRHYVVAAYRGYYNERWPRNLPVSVVRRKADVLNVYGGEPGSCGFAAGCGDYDVGKDRSYGTGWMQRTSPRYPGNATWMLPGPDGRLTAFGVLDQQAAMWQETAPGSGTWDGPKLLGGGQLLPTLTASLTKDGRWQLFAERIAGLGVKPEENRREIVTVEQRSKGGAFGGWTSLGNPETDPTRGRRVGAPVVARNADGSLQLFARNWAKGVATRQQQPDGSWSPWTDLPEAEVQEGLTAITDAKGRVHLFGAGHDTVSHWEQQTPGGPFSLDRSNLPASVDPPAALAKRDGSVQLVFREAKSTNIVAYRLPPGGGTWQRENVDLAGRGFGALSLLAAPSGGDGTLIAARNNDGSTSLVTIGAGGNRAPRWSTVPGAVVGTAALATSSGSGDKPLLGWLGPDGKLHSARVK